MVCVPCIFIPVLLFLWHRFIQPYVLRFWNPWATKDEKNGETEFPFTCKGGVCPFPNKSAVKNKEDNAGSETQTNTDQPVKNKSD